MNYLFTPNYQFIGNTDPIATVAELADEQGMYSASPEFLKRHGGPIANRIFDSVPQSWFDECYGRRLFPNIDIRIHRLYPGDYPAFPGWHCDNSYRETYFSQPDLDRTPVSNSIICTVSSHENGVSNTEFLDEVLDYEFLQEPTSEQSLWGMVDRHLNDLANRLTLGTTIVPDGTIVLFDSASLHRANPTHTRGWRLFFRMSQWHKPYLDYEGKLTKSEQVYRMVGHAGW